MPLGTTIHNIELQPGKGGQVARAAGTVAQIVAKQGRLATLRLPSGEVRLVLQKCLATVGQVGNIDANNQSLGKAGSKRWLGKRPKVRGVVMNAADHPHGGGEGPDRQACYDGRVRGRTRGIRGPSALPNRNFKPFVYASDELFPRLRSTISFSVCIQFEAPSFDSRLYDE